MRPVLVALLLAAGLPGAGWAADDPAEAACHLKDTTIAISDCLQGLTGQWDKRLNAAYQTALKASENDARKNALIRAERAWLAFRTANCAWYDAQEGTIREIYAANCMLDMTRARAVELEQALKP
ncbi:MAG TPA: lysozyme inhibitor LprI family protein [Acetobacteraceae bacterium]|jgi:uncharacterized protein YecT (DUF1311 family)|nr:lysozyme inhibitor LprI family protein [Acetobacteraceae bacterium]